MASKSRRKTTRPQADEVAARAYEIYLVDDRPGDHALEHWLRAEKELMERSESAASVQAAVQSEPGQGWISEQVIPQNALLLKPASALVH